MVVEKETQIVSIAEAVEDTDDGTAELQSALAVSVGGAGQPKAIWIKSVYGIPNAAAGVLLFWHVTTPGTWVAQAAANTDFAFYMSATGDGITGVNIGPITSDLYICSDGTFDCTALNRITIEYDQV